MAKPELGTKRECPECAAKFYDLARSPCVCPKCSFSYEPDVAVVRTAEKVKPKEVVKKPPVEAEQVETVSLDELGAEEQDAQSDLDDGDEAVLADIEIVDDSVDVDDDDDDLNDAFLDTDDDDETDVTGIIGTGIGKGDNDT